MTTTTTVTTPPCREARARQVTTESKTPLEWRTSQNENLFKIRAHIGKETDERKDNKKEDADEKKRVSHTGMRAKSTDAKKAEVSLFVAKSEAE